MPLTRHVSSFSQLPVPMVIRDVSTPKVCYPKVAKAARASGTVEIEVVIDEKGNVIWARAIKGHPLLRLAALRAACRTRIKPIIDCQGKAVKVTPSCTSRSNYRNEFRLTTHSTGAAIASFS